MQPSRMHQQVLLHRVVVEQQQHHPTHVTPWIAPADYFELIRCVSKRGASIPFSGTPGRRQLLLRTHTSLFNVVAKYRTCYGYPVYRRRLKQCSTLRGFHPSRSTDPSVVDAEQIQQHIRSFNLPPPRLLGRLASHQEQQHIELKKLKRQSLALRAPSCQSRIHVNLSFPGGGENTALGPTTSEDQNCGSRTKTGGSKIPSFRSKG
ncbi:uncharacterized protein LTR77_007612 [Saxophila tyrrhenica]|uniref:Uncharacterized protein n=1 Tax=Saxophila tyrrhenica TaxID=1690608 RepID=A0AAV9P6K4_9PEZI|nr:hypothetical protein LTR77_007612 [Saxophila tyrrhenica]